LFADFETHDTAFDLSLLDVVVHSPSVFLPLCLVGPLDKTDAESAVSVSSEKCGRPGKGSLCREAICASSERYRLFFFLLLLFFVCLLFFDCLFFAVVSVSSTSGSERLIDVAHLHSLLAAEPLFILRISPAGRAAISLSAQYPCGNHTYS
jgi:hypothetical protein